MAAFTTMAIVGAAAVGTAATIDGVMSQKRAAKRQQASLKQQENLSKETAKLDLTREGTEADIRLGRADAAADGVDQPKTGTGINTTGSVSARVGGLKGKRASAAVGL